jgi:hypothetical protein
MMLYAITSYQKNTAPSLALSCSHFPTIPAIPTALEVEPANFGAAADTRRANQDSPLGTALAANIRFQKNWNFVHVGQQLGTRHHFPIAQDDEENPGISRLYT